MESRFLSEISILSHLILLLIQIYLHDKMHKLPLLLEIKQIEFVIFWCFMLWHIVFRNYYKYLSFKNLYLKTNDYLLIN